MAFHGPKFEYEDPIDGTTTITFPLPPEGDPLRERLRARERTQKSATGISQTQFFYDETSFELRMVFLDETIINDLRKWYYRYAKFGKEFKFFPDSSESLFFNVTLARKEFRPSRVRSDGAGGFEYDLKFELESLEAYPIS
jgi:hypothetical protein